MPVSPCFWPCRRGDRRISQVPREPIRTSALLLDPGRTLAPGLGRSGAAPAGIKAKAPAIRIFRGSIPQLLCPLPTLEAVISGDSPRLASGWWPPFPGGALVPHGVPVKNFRIWLLHRFLSFWICLGAICRVPTLRFAKGAATGSPAGVYRAEARAGGFASASCRQGRKRPTPHFVGPLPLPQLASPCTFMTGSTSIPLAGHPQTIRPYHRIHGPALNERRKLFLHLRGSWPWSK
jgi:hypothetical protein